MRYMRNRKLEILMNETLKNIRRKKFNSFFGMFNFYQRKFSTSKGSCDVFLWRCKRGHIAPISRCSWKKWVLLNSQSELKTNQAFLRLKAWVWLLDFVASTFQFRSFKSEGNYFVDDLRMQCEWRQDGRYILPYQLWIKRHFVIKKLRLLLIRELVSLWKICSLWNKLYTCKQYLSVIGESKYLPIRSLIFIIDLFYKHLYYQKSASLFE